jgi:cytochrome o ubiquinol oxidase subunit 2
LAGCGGVLDPQGPVGASEKLILINSVAIMLVIVVPALLATTGFAWWFRASNARATYLPNWAFSGHLELIMWTIPALVITFLGGIAWFGSHALDPYKPLSPRTKPS